MKKIINIFLVLSVLLVVSCDNDLTELNENPNGVNPSSADPNLLISTVMTGIATELTSQGYTGNMGHAAQYIQKDSWASNDYSWEGDGWNSIFGNLRTNKLANDRATELGLGYHQGITLVLKSYLFGNLTDRYGDVPYSNALQGDQEGVEFITPVFDSQESVYKGIIADLEAASQLFKGDYESIHANQDVFFGGDVAKWEKFANSLTLRYYMRLSEKLPAYAAAGVAATLAKPLISSVDEELNVDYIGSSDGDSWPSNSESGDASSFFRVKPSQTMVDMLRGLDDPRMALWFAPVAIPITVVALVDTPNGLDDEVVDGVRYISEEKIASIGGAIYNPATWRDDVAADKIIVDTNSDYVGLPVNVLSSAVFNYNLNLSPELGGDNDHVSHLNHDTFDAKANDYTKARLLTYAEVSFLKAEAALKGWGSDAEGNYNKGVEASLEAWGLGADYSTYIAGDAAFDGTLEQLISQKWIAGFTQGMEAWYDWRRTGLPALNSGPFAQEDVIPIRFLYESDEINRNLDNYNAALNSLSETSYSADNDGTDSTYSKMWLMQGSGVAPW